MSFPYESVSPTSSRDVRPSYHVDASSVNDADLERFLPLNESLAEQVQNTRTNLIDKLSDAEMESDSTKDSFDGCTSNTIQVLLRLRPFLEHEVDEDQDCIKVTHNRSVKACPPANSATHKSLTRNGQAGTSFSFNFSRVFRDTVDQAEFYDNATGPYIQEFLGGQNVLIFTYGVTNSGKSYTIKGTSQNPGILPRALKELFTEYGGKISHRCDLKPRLYSDILRLAPDEVRAELSFRDRFFDTLAGDISSLRRSTSASNLSNASSNLQIEDKSSSFSSLPDALDLTKVHEASRLSQSDCTFSIWISFCEIYNENVFDLLEPVKSGMKRSVLKLSEDPRGNIYVKGLREVCVFSFEEALQLLETGRHNLSVASTKLNYSSSRSHCIYSVRVLRVSAEAGSEQHVQRIHKLTFCDLAGSERSIRTENTGERLKESCNINTSLLTLGRCIKTKRYNQQNLRLESQRLIPFRDSKLTRLFQNALSGDGKACMIVCASQCAGAFDETLHVLKFAAIAQKVVTQKSVSNTGLCVFNPAGLNPIKSCEPVNPDRASSTSGPTRNIVHSGSNLCLDSLAVGDSSSYLGDQESFASEEPDEDATPVPSTVHKARIPLAESTGYNLKIQLDKKDHIIQQLTKLLKEEKTKNYKQESKIREEVCAQYAQYIAELKRDYQQDLEEGIGEAEEVAEERIDLYIQSAKKSRRSEAIYRLDENDQEEDGWVPATLLSDTQRQLEEKVAEIQLLQTKLKETVAMSDPIADSADMERDSVESNVVDSSTPASSMGADMETQLQAEKAKCKEMEALLSEAGDAFKEKEADISELERVNKEQQSAMTEMAQTLETIQAKVDEFTQEIKEKDARIKELEDEKSKTADIKTDERMEVDDEKMKDLEGKLMAKDAQLTAMQAELEQVKTTAAAAAQAMDAQPRPSSDEDPEMKLIQYESKIFDVEKERDSALESLEEMKKTGEDLFGKVSVLEEALDAAKADVQKKADELESSTLKHRETVEQLEESIANLKTEVEDSKQREQELLEQKTSTEKSLTSKSNEYNSTVGKVEELIKRIESLQKECSDLKTRCETTKKSADEAETKSQTLKATLEKAVQGQVASEAAKSGLEKELSDAKKHLELLSASNSESQTAREAELISMRKHNQQLQCELEAERSKIGQLVEERNKLTSNIAEMEQRLGKQAELSGQLESKERQITYLQSNHSLEIQKLSDELNKTRAQVANLNKVSSDQQQETATLRTQLDLHVQKSHLIEKQLSETTLKKEEAVSQLNRFKSEHAKDRQNQEQMKQAIAQLEQTQHNRESLLKEKDGRLDYMHRDLQATKTKLTTSENEAMKAKHECSMLRVNVDQLSKQLMEASNTKESLQSELSNTKMQFNESLRSATANEHAIHALKKEIEAKINFYEQQKQAAVHKNQMLLSEKDKELAEAHRRTQTAEKHAAEMSKELNKSQDDHKTLKEELELEYERMKAENAGSIDRDLQNARDEIKDLTRQKSELSNRITQLELDLKTAQDNLAVVTLSHQNLSQQPSVIGGAGVASSMSGQLASKQVRRATRLPNYVGTDAAKPDEPEEGEEQMTVDLTSVTPEESSKKSTTKSRRGRPPGTSSRKRQASETSHVSGESTVSHQDFLDSTAVSTGQSVTKSGSRGGSTKKIGRPRGTGKKAAGKGRKTNKTKHYDSDDDDLNQDNDQFFAETSMSPSVVKPSTSRTKSGAAARGRSAALQVSAALAEAPAANSRPTRRAKTSAADGILAASMNWHTAVETFAKQTFSYVSVGSPLSQVEEEDDESTVPPKKRKRTLFNPSTQTLNESASLLDDGASGDPKEEVDNVVETVTRSTRRLRGKK